MATESACLLLTDISGYTGYLAGVELDHAQDILVGATNHGMHGEGASIEEILDWRPYDYFTYRNTVPTAMGPPPLRYLETTEFEPTPDGTILHQRFAAPKTPKERAIMEQIASWMEEVLRTSSTRLIEQLDEELERRDRDATQEPVLPRARPDGPVVGLPSAS